MNPNEVKAVRKHLGLTQKNFAVALGVGKLTMSQYETGFRTPGPSAQVLLYVLGSLPKKKALELISLLQDASEALGLGHKGSK